MLSLPPPEFCLWLGTKDPFQAAAGHSHSRSVLHLSVSSFNFVIFHFTCFSVMLVDAYTSSGFFFLLLNKTGKCQFSFQSQRRAMLKDVKVKVTQAFLTLCDPVECSPPRLLCPWNSQEKNTGLGSHSLLQRIFLTQGSNQSLPHCRQTLYYLSHQKSLKNVQTTL